MSRPTRPARVVVPLALALGVAMLGAPAPAASPHARTPAATAAEPLVLQTPRYRVVVDQQPFRITVQDGQGHTVLQEVAPDPTGSQVVPPTTDPLLTGVDNQDTTTLYSPLTFLVGTEQLTQYPADEWIANLHTGTRAGIEYAAKDVVSADQQGAGLRLVLSTTDPTGRQLIVSIRPHGRGAVRVTATPDPADGVAMVGDSFVAGPKDGFFGFGGRHDLLDQRGQVLSSFVEQENLAASTTVGPATAGLPAEYGMFPNGPSAAYYPQGEFFTRHYGFLLAQPELARFKLAADRGDAWNVTASAQHLDYLVAPGGPHRSVAAVTGLTGRQPVPPRWALGPMLDRLVKNQGETFADYQSKLKSDLRHIDRLHLPLSAYRIEGWGFPGSATSGDSHGLALHTWVRARPQARMIRKLRERGIHPLAYLRPWLEPDSPPVAKGYAVRDANGDPYYVVGSGERRFALVDFTNPAAVRWWQRQVKDVFKLGFDGFMQDYGEQVLLDMHFHDGTTGVTRHNSYLTLYAKATRGAVKDFRRSHPRRHPWFFTRAGYTGLPGAAAYEGGNFPGDETTDWGHATGLRSLATDMLNRSVGGAYGFGTDIGGYFDYTTPATDKELFLRWAEWAALSPVFRLHGTGLAGTHTPWSYDAQTVRIYTRLSRLHLRARPLIQRLWRQAQRTGAPVTRPLWWQDIGDRSGWHRDQEWLLGPNLLAAPIVTEGASARHVYLPRGCWRLHGDGDRLRGGRQVRVRASLAEVPWFSRCGTRPLG